MTLQRLNFSTTLAALPPELSISLTSQIQHQVAVSGRKVVVLDDDPTGTQTVYDIPVLTEWSIPSLEEALLSHKPAFYILTNTRSVPSDQAQAINRQIGANLVEAAQRTHRDFVVVSRSDSTLRGHFPDEVIALEESLKQTFDGWLLIPYFLEGGRYTLNDIHYVAEGDTLVPAAKTPFAQDAAFGYKSSNLRAWVEEKTNGRIPADEVASISIADIRQGSYEQVAQKLMGLVSGKPCIVNAASPRDIELFVLGLLQAEAQGKHFLYRTAASFVQVRAGLAARPLLQSADLELPREGGGLIIVGSYVPKTTSQVNTLLEKTDLVKLEIDVEHLLDETRRATALDQIVNHANWMLAQNQDVLLYTSRRLITVDDATGNLSIGQRVSESLVEIVRRISVQPRYILAKGGITSSDIATQGLGIKKAMVLGQILPGVPVWQAGPESRYPDLVYIVFPGNVGDSNALVEVVDKLQ
ncbi:MAG: four-carbon acid sugar kinase family protein [Chloroflexota bacterium]